MQIPEKFKNKSQYLSVEYFTQKENFKFHSPPTQETPIHSEKVLEKSFLFLWTGAFCLNIIAFFLIVLQNGIRGLTIALKYSVSSGVLWYGNSNNLFFIPAMGLIFFACNYFLFFKTKNSKFLHYSIVLINAFVQLLLLVGLIFLASIN